MSAVAEAHEAIETEFASGDAVRAAKSAASDELHQFLIFYVEQETFAVSLSEVREIVRLPELVQVPMSPPTLAGIANLRGTVLPIVDLRRIFSLPQALHDDATRVVVLDQGKPVGLIVDRMKNVVGVEADSIESADTIRSTIDVDLLTGVIKNAGDEPMVMVLDAEQLISREFASARELIEQAAALADLEEQTPQTRHLVETANDDDQLVSFEVVKQEYAFPIEKVQEIIQRPERVTTVPNTASHVIGVVTLRNRLLPLVSLRRMFGMPASDAVDGEKVAVLTLSGEISVGVVMDSVKEVLRVDRALIEPLPRLLSDGRTENEIKSICRLSNGKRLVSILAPDRMFDVEEIRKVAEQVSAEAVSEAESAIETEARPEEAKIVADQNEEEQFIVYRLMGEEYGVPIEAVQEIVRVPDTLTRIPNAPDFIEGVINLRGTVLPVVDQRRRLHMEQAERHDRQRIIVFTIRNHRTGFIVDSVSEVTRIPAKAIGPAPDLSAEQQRLIRRVANLDKQKRMILLLDVDQLLDGEEVNAVEEAVAA